VKEEEELTATVVGFVIHSQIEGNGIGCGEVQEEEFTTPMKKKDESTRTP